MPAPFLRLGFQQLDLTEIPAESQQLDGLSTPVFSTTEKSFNVTLTEERNPQSTGVVHIGQLHCNDIQCDDQACRRSKIVAKIGFNTSDKDVLVHENQVYTHLHKHGVKGIPKNIGIFSDFERYGVEEIEGPYALILSYVGSSLHGRADTIPREAK